jgi:diguanylate cyclase (GGDEF)-like protein
MEIAKDSAITFYLLAAGAQCYAAWFAADLFFRSASYRIASGSLAIALTLMISRRVSPLYRIFVDGYFDLFDAALALTISVLLLIGLRQVKGIIMDLEEKNFALDRSSKIDSLTQVLSRSETFARAELEIERALRNLKPVAFLLMDIDYFKRVNDQYGHAIGDLVLQSLANICKQELRAIDIFGRVGGEEFLIVLPENSESLALDVAERIRSKVFSSVAVETKGIQISISVSIGVAIFSPKTNSQKFANAIMRESYQKADEAMYIAKENGRNCSKCWTQQLEVSY